MSFSGAAKLKSAVTTVNRNFYQSHSSYLKARGKNYDSNAIVHPLPGIEYNKATTGGSEIIWPEKMQKVDLAESPYLGQNLNSSFYRGNSCVPTLDHEVMGTTNFMHRRIVHYLSINRIIRSLQCKVQ